MAALCRAAHDVTSTAITAASEVISLNRTPGRRREWPLSALGHQTYGR
ncbi:hypothetical protein [Streptomyces sp. NPDC086989]